ncbi:MAG TPA: TMEM175 family protein [Solirubrobacteraceae bacterium]|nr:TMEM175 family protein [Solirubrobacteraceae bacterium]
MTERPETPRGSRPERAVGGAFFSISRLEAFSDGVFAIAITLLVLDLAVGAAGRRHLLRALVELWPSYLAYVTSFFMIGLVWIGHHVILSISTGVDRRLTKINLVLLFAVAFLPFPTRLLGEFIRDPHAERVAAVFYGLSLLFISVTLAGMWRYISGKRRLLPDDFSQAQIDHLTRSFQPNIAFYGFAIVLALILPEIAAALFLIIAVGAFIRTA